MLYFILLLPDKQTCIELKDKIKLFLSENLKLELNDKSRYYPMKMGVNFCGYRIFPTHKLLRLNSKKKIKRNIKKWNKKYYNKNLDLEKTIQRLNSWLGHSSHCNSFKLQKKVLNSCAFLLNNSFYQKNEEELINYIDNQKFDDC